MSLKNIKIASELFRMDEDTLMKLNRLSLKESFVTWWVRSVGIFLIFVTAFGLYFSLNFALLPLLGMT